MNQPDEEPRPLGMDALHAAVADMDAEQTAAELLVADAVAVGHAALRLCGEYLARGEWATAHRWDSVAATHCAFGAAETLADIVDSMASPDTHGDGIQLPEHPSPEIAPHPYLSLATHSQESGWPPAPTEAGESAVAPEPVGRLLARQLEARGWTQAQFAVIIGRPVQVVNEIVNGKKSITRESAAHIGAALDTSAEFWLNQQARFHLHVQAHDVGLQKRLAAIRERAARKELPSAARDDLVEVGVQALRRGMAGFVTPYDEYGIVAQVVVDALIAAGEVSGAAPNPDSLTTHSLGLGGEPLPPERVAHLVQLLRDMDCQQQDTASREVAWYYWRDDVEDALGVPRGTCNNPPPHIDTDETTEQQALRGLHGQALAVAGLAKSQADLHTRLDQGAVAEHCNAAARHALDAADALGRARATYKLLPSTGATCGNAAPNPAETQETP